MEDITEYKGRSIVVLEHGCRVFVVDAKGVAGENATVGTVRGYAEQYNENPDEAEQHARDHNATINNSKYAAYRQQEIQPHAWMTLDGIMITTVHSKRVHRIVVKVNELVSIEEQVYQVVPTNNHNFTLKLHPHTK